MSNLIPPIAPPMSPSLRVRLYGAFSWVGGFLFLAFVTVGALESQGIDVSTPVTAALGVASALLNGIDVWLKLVAKSNVPDTGQPFDDTDLTLG